jgi:hypothetical protein
MKLFYISCILVGLNAKVFADNVRLHYRVRAYDADEAIEKAMPFFKEWAADMNKKSEGTCVEPDDLYWEEI